MGSRAIRVMVPSSSVLTERALGFDKVASGH
jgi:hypothetical protein